MNTTPTLGLYVHIPFCKQKCIYCDFASWPNSESRIEPYLAALKDELNSWRGALKDYELSTMFIGGGTPSILSGDQIASLMESVRSVLPVREGAENNIWRLFYTKSYNGDPKTLPEESSLMRIYKKHLMSGGTMDVGSGFRY